jgi:hypothetical protein
VSTDTGFVSSWPFDFLNIELMRPGDKKFLHYLSVCFALFTELYNTLFFILFLDVIALGMVWG